MNLLSWTWCVDHIKTSDMFTIFYRFLSYLSRTYPYPMLEHVARLKDLLDYFSYMHGEVSTSLVTALLPLIKLSRDLQVVSLAQLHD